MTAIPHRRFNALTRSWLVCSPHRTQRPWLGASESVNHAPGLQHDSTCFLCPRNKRATGDCTNPDFRETYVFPNDFAALLPPPPVEAASEVDVGEAADKPIANDKVLSLRSQLLRCEPVSGTCTVGCFSPRHDLALAAMTQEEIVPVLRMWTSLYENAGAATDEAASRAREYVSYVQIFENKGEMMGCSNPHPHCQSWSTSVIPQEPLRELEAADAYRTANDGACLLCDYVKLELEDEMGVRIVYKNDNFAVIVPYWALWPFETLLVSITHQPSLSDLSEQVRFDLADAIRVVTCKYDNMFQCAFPYSMGIHQAPTTKGLHEYAESHADCGGVEGARQLSHLHLHFYPPLLRSATVRKFMVGFEMLAEPQRDITAEISAERLRSLDGILHYSVRANATPDPSTSS